jgi:Tol biopolymer transport system component
MDLGSRKIEILRADLNRDVDEIAVSRDGRRLAYTVNEEGVSKLYVMDTSTRKEVRLPAVPAGVIGGGRG